ncbi:MAG: hypothetical protein IPJ65_03605 [Archangiaceae bacterium]|nr:hypothetical protein [Archangiaceae bacterium]
MKSAVIRVLAVVVLTGVSAPPGCQPQVSLGQLDAGTTAGGAAGGTSGGGAGGTAAAGPCVVGDLAPLPLALDGNAAVWAGGRLYSLGGWSVDPEQLEWVPNQTVWSYDEASNAWRAEPPHAFTGEGTQLRPTVGPGGRIYVLQGNRLAIFDPATSAWSMSAPSSLPTGRTVAATLAGTSSRVYLFWGRTVLAYDPVTDAWQTRSPALSNREQQDSAVAADGTIYLFRGTDLVNQNCRPSGVTDPHCGNEVFAYQPSTDTWSQLADHHVGPPTTVVVQQFTPQVAVGSDGRFYFLSFPGITDVFDPTTRTWSAVDAANDFHASAFAASLVTGRIFFLGGLGPDAATVTAVRAWDPATRTMASTTCTAVCARSELFTVPRKTDLLVVVDDSCSMASKQAALAAASTELFSYALDAGVDFRVGVTTTTVETSALNGRLLGAAGARVLDPSTPNVATAFAGLVDAGINGSGVEQPLAAAQLALTAPNITGPNAGLLRADATLSVLLFTDAADGSGDPVFGTPVSDYTDALLAVHGAAARNQLLISGLVPTLQPAPASCGYDDAQAADDTRLARAIASTGGARVEICDLASTPATARQLGAMVFGARPVWFLSGRPAPSNGSSLSVALDGLTLPPADWSYDSARNAVVFAAGRAPAPGQVVGFSYAAGCP